MARSRHELQREGEMGWEASLGCVDFSCILRSGMPKAGLSYKVRGKVRGKVRLKGCGTPGLQGSKHNRRP